MANVVPNQKITQASGGNQYLKEVLSSLAQNTTVTQQVTNVATKNAPPQCRAQVSLLNGSYVVEIQNPGTLLPTSALQAAQNGNAPTANVAITPLYHQIRCANTPRFSVAANVQTFGGTTGSTQTYWTLQLAAGQWYFQIRSSYDGTNFNEWKNANGGQALNAPPETVTVQPANNATWGAFALPGGQAVAFGAGFLPDLQSYGLPDNLYTSAMQSIASPNGFTEYGHPMHGISANIVNAEIPVSNVGLLGPPDYPTSVPMKYRDGSGNIWPGSSNVFAFCFDPLGPNVARFFYATGTWGVFEMPGGWQLAVGSGQVADGTVVTVPPGFVSADMISVVSAASFNDTGHPAHGISQAYMDAAGRVHVQYADGSGNHWNGNGNWMAVAWSPGVPIATVQGGRFVVFTLPGGRLAAIGGGQVTSGTPFGLPTGLPGGVVAGVSGVCPSSYSDQSSNATQNAAALYGLNPASPALVTGVPAGQGMCTWDAFPSSQTDGLVLSVTVQSVGYVDNPTAPYVTVAYVLNATTTVIFATSAPTSQAVTLTANLPKGFDLNTLAVVVTAVSGAGASDTQCGVAISDMHVAGAITPVGGDGGTGSAPPTGGGGTGGGTGTGTGGGGGGGGGSACTMAGTVLDTPEGPVDNRILKERFDRGETVLLQGRECPERVLAMQWVEDEPIWTIMAGTTNLFCSGSHLLNTRMGYLRCEKIPYGVEVETRDGWERLHIVFTGRHGKVLALELEGPSHEYSSSGLYSHNKRLSNPNESMPAEAASAAFAASGGSDNGGYAFNIANLLGIATPGTFVDTGHPAHGISRCSLVGNTPELSYEDGEGNSWSGNANWFVFAWE